MDKLKAYLAGRGISVADFARSIGVHERTAYKYVRGERLPDRNIMQRIYRFTDGAVAPNDFYDLEGHAPVSTAAGAPAA